METNNRVGLRICNKIGVHTCRLGAIHLNEREEKILQDYLTTHEREARKKFIEKMCNSKFIIGYYEDETFVEYPMYEAVEIALDYPPTLPEDKQ